MEESARVPSNRLRVVAIAKHRVPSTVGNQIREWECLPLESSESVHYCSDPNFTWVAVIAVAHQERYAWLVIETRTPRSASEVTRATQRLSERRGCMVPMP